MLDFLAVVLRVTLGLAMVGGIIVTGVGPLVALSNGDGWIGAAIVFLYGIAILGSCGVVALLILIEEHLEKLVRLSTASDQRERDAQRAR
jgi:hypothetical protein